MSARSVFRCTYCSDVADTMDHVVPVSSVRVVRRHNETKGRSKVVPCCRECNDLLGSVALKSVGARAGHLVLVLTRRYKKLLRTPYRSRRELDELGYALRELVVGGLAVKRLVESRIAHAKWVLEVSPSIDEVWAVHDSNTGEIQ